MGFIFSTARMKRVCGERQTRDDNIMDEQTLDKTTIMRMRWNYILVVSECFFFSLLFSSPKRETTRVLQLNCDVTNRFEQFQSGVLWRWWWWMRISYEFWFIRHLNGIIQMIINHFRSKFIRWAICLAHYNYNDTQWGKECWSSKWQIWRRISKFIKQEKNICHAFYSFHLKGIYKLAYKFEMIIFVMKFQKYFSSIWQVGLVSLNFCCLYIVSSGVIIHHRLTRFFFDDGISSLFSQKFFILIEFSDESSPLAHFTTINIIKIYEFYKILLTKLKDTITKICKRKCFATYPPCFLISALLYHSVSLE